MSPQRSARHATPSGAALRGTAAGVALDAARTPTAGAAAAALAARAREFAALDGAMAATAAALRRAGAHADMLRREADEWTRLERDGPALRDALDALVASIDPKRRKEPVAGPATAGEGTLCGDAGTGGG
jgi:hypothetical protein